MEPQDFKTRTANQLDPITECYKNGTFIPCTQLPPPLLSRYTVFIKTVYLGKWGTFKIQYTSNRDILKIESVMDNAIDAMKKMFSKKLIDSGDVTAQNCLVNIQDSYNRESGSYNGDVKNCQIKTKLSLHSDYTVLRHEMFHALFNGFLEGKDDSMPRMFTEGWADVAGGRSSESNLDALNKIGAHSSSSSINSLSDLVELLRPKPKPYNDNYVLGAQYFYFCMNTSPGTLLRYVNKIKISSYVNYYDYHSSKLHGMTSLEKECSLADFISWLKHPDYTIQDPNLTIESRDIYYDIILAYDNGMNKVFRCKQQSKIHIPKNISSQYCSKAYDIVPFAKDRVIFSHSQGIVVITNELADQGFTILHKVGANIEKRFCAITGEWVYNKILNFRKSKICIDTIQNEIVNLVKQCRSQPPTAEDIGIFGAVSLSVEISRIGYINNNIIYQE